MNQTQRAAVDVELPQEAKKPARNNPRPLPPHAVIVLNDEEHSFEYVMEVFQKVFGYSREKCFLLTKEIHEKGRGIVWSGTKELAELKREQIHGAAPDVNAERRIDWPLEAIIEPLPG